MDIEQIVSDLKSERDRVDQAIAALQGSQARRRGRPRGSKRRLSAEGRQRIIQAAKKRWAKFRASKKK